jgi:murein L,D-transpeptidase YafK
MRALHVLLLVTVLAGCDPFARFRPVKVAPPPPVAMLDDDDTVAWAATEPWAIVVRRSCRTLDVYRNGRRVRSYPAVFGLASRGDKLHEGDLRTPTGFYMIVDKRPHVRWGYFMLLDYPNTHDRERYWRALQAGELPERGDGWVGIGGQVGIHGSDKPALNGRNVDWTFGCISLQTRDVSELASLVPVGTPVLIED